MKYIKTYENKNYYEHLPEFGDILFSYDGGYTYVMLEKLGWSNIYGGNPMLYDIRRNSITEMTPRYLDGIIQENYMIVKNVSTVFDTTPELVVKLYNNIKEILFNNKKDISQSIDIFGRLDAVWLLNVPELKFHIEANKYNL